MEKRAFSRFLLLTLGLVATLVIIAAGGMRLEVVRPIEDGAACANKTHTVEGHKRDSSCAGTHVVAMPTDAVPGSPSANVLECPPYKLVEPAETREIARPVPSFTEVLNDFFRVLVRSLIRPNAP